MNAYIPPLYDPKTLTADHKALLASLPFDDLIFRKLFDFLDEILGSYRCNHNFEWTQQFLKKQGIELSKHIDFFSHHEISCDCEIIFLLESKFPVDLNEFKRRMPN